MDGKETYFCNMKVAKKPLFDEFLWTSDITGRLSDILTIAQIYEAESATGMPHSGYFGGTKDVDELYAIIDRLKELDSDPVDLRRIAEIVVEWDLSVALVRMVFFTDYEEEELLRSVSGLAENFAQLGDMNRPGYYANMAIGLAGN